MSAEELPTCVWVCWCAERINIGTHCDENTELVHEHTGEGHGVRTIERGTGYVLVWGNDER